MGLKHEPDEACGPSKQYVSMDTSRVLTHQTAVNVTGKTTRSTSDPVTQESSKSFNPVKEERPLSAPSISNLYGNMKNMKILQMQCQPKASAKLLRFWDRGIQA